MPVPTNILLLDDSGKHEKLTTGRQEDYLYIEMKI